MKLALIGDPHFANRRLFGKPTRRAGVNSRLEAVEQAIVNIAKDLEKDKDIDQVVILGDITHEHGRLTPPVLQAVNNALYALNFAGMAVTLIDGNHDMDASGLSINDAFVNEDEENRIEACHVAMRVFWSYPVAVHAIPFCSVEETRLAFEEIERDAKQFPNDAGSVVLMHGHFDGAKHGAHEFQPPGGISPSDIPDCVQLVISGHYHMYQKLTEKLLYIGAPFQHDFGEAQYEPGYMILDFAKNGEVTWERRVFDSAPRFHILPHNLGVGNIPGDPNSDYYRIDLPSDVDPTEIKDLKDALTNIIIKPIPIDADMRSRVEEYLENKGEKVEFVDVMEAYVSMHAEPKLVVRLEELGMDIMRETLGGE